MIKRSARIATCGNLVTIFGVLAFLLACLFAHIAPSHAAKDHTRPVDPQTTSAIQATNGKIYFNSDRDGNPQIYSINPDGSDQIRLTNDSAIDADPSWSNTSKKIVFASNRDGRFQIYAMDADGRNQTRVTNNSANDGSPAWSPDGHQVAFASDRGGNYEIYKMNADGSSQTRLTFTSGTDVNPAWSPDGSKIAFQSNHDGNFQIYVINADGSVQTRLSNNTFDDEFPDWSPDGTKIAFASMRDSDQEIYVMNADGSNQTRLTNTPGSDGLPVWSPDGTKIAFETNRDGHFQIYSMNADGTNQRRVSNNPVGTDENPTWAATASATPTPSPTPTPTVTVHSISGRIIYWGLGVPFVAPGVSVLLVGSIAGTATTDNTGFYSFNNLPDGGTYTVSVPNQGGFKFLPSSGYTFVNSASDQRADFERVPVYKVSGRVTDSGGFGVPDVNLTLRIGGCTGPNFNPSLSAITDADGNYTFGDLGPAEINYFYAVSFAVDPRKPGYSFNPDFEPNIGIFSRNQPKTVTVNFTAGYQGAHWNNTGSLNAARADHTATLLTNGKVLVVGGGANATGAELYDPNSGTWRFTGSLNNARTGHTTTLLSNGKVLVTSGTSAELYDPLLGTWGLTASPNTAHMGHTATPLQNGKVLVAGGGTAAAELYDLSSGIWTVTGSLSAVRSGHTATLLTNGKVLVVSGASAELYDPTSGTWKATGSPTTSRLGHTATLLTNGKVLVTGGDITAFPQAGKTAEIYDPISETWASTASMINARTHHSATLLPDGDVLVAGGMGQVHFCKGILTNAELYDPGTVTWTSVGQMSNERTNHTATLVQNGQVLMAGGKDVKGNSLVSSELFTAYGANSIDSTNFFVRQHYLDFLNREPDAAGFAFWTNEITSCGSNQSCIAAKRINVSAAFFLSIEFQQTGYLVERTYKAAYGDASGGSTFGGAHQLKVPIVRFNEFLPDTQRIGQGVVVGQTGWETVLENNKQAFAAEFVQRARFANAFPTTLTPAQFVDSLFGNAGITPASTDRNAAIAEFGSAADTTNVVARGRALRRVAEDSILNTQEFNRAFVLMQYFGYLRRNPNDSPDSDYSGYDFWLTKLNQFNGNFINAEMVKAFISSTEYRQRFGP